jgi:hypothetical protein
MPEGNFRELSQALRLARHGLPVFPCWHGDKRPATGHGFKEATVDPVAIRAWSWLNRLIGVPTGSISGIAVLDIDPRHGGDDWLKVHAKRLPVARSHVTRSGGLHLLFRHGGDLRNSAGLIAPGVDVRAEGGYIIWWPAHGGLILDCVPLGILPPWPTWLTPQRQRAGRFEGNRTGRVVADHFQISVLAKFVRESRAGERNTRLFWAACRLAEMEFVVAGQQREAASKLLFAAAIATGLDGGEAARTIESALSGGAVT